MTRRTRDPGRDAGLPQRPRHHGPRPCQPGRRRTACDRCGAATIDRCPTCGTDLPGAIVVPGLAAVGTRAAAACCRSAGAALPWTRDSQPAAATPRPRSNGCSAGCRGRSASCAGDRESDRRSAWKMKGIWKTFCGHAAVAIRRGSAGGTHAALRRRRANRLPPRAGADRRRGQDRAAASLWGPADGADEGRRGVLPRPAQLPHPHGPYLRSGRA